MLCQRLCAAKVEWDEPLTEDHLTQWTRLQSALQGPSIVIPRCMYHLVQPKSIQLVGFCDASAMAYAAVVYLRLEKDDQDIEVQFLAAKTRVTPVMGMTIPRLELLSALLLAKLLTSVQGLFPADPPLQEPACFTDSKASMYWIKGVQHDWKQLVENRVSSIRKLVHPNNWHHCPGRENPADIPSRGMGTSALSETTLWLKGPKWLVCKTSGNLDDPTDSLTMSEIPENCKTEMKCKDPASTLVATTTIGQGANSLSVVFDANRYSTSRRLFGVTAYVLKFVRQARKREHHYCLQLTVKELEEARLLWLKDSQTFLQSDSQFLNLKKRLDLFLDESGLWRCGGRMSNADLSLSAQNPILLERNHPLTILLIRDAHERVFHNGVRETLAELRFVYWVIRGRQTVKRTIHSCVTCRKQEGPACIGVPSPPLPDFRVTQSRPFQTTGVDYAGPLYVKSPLNKTVKAWVILYTCYVTRAIHLDLVQDMTAKTFVRSLRRFAARRGTPAMMFSDNAKTFKSAAVALSDILNSLEARKFCDVGRVEWRFNLKGLPGKEAPLSVW